MIIKFEGYKSKIDKKIKNFDKYKNYVPGMYIVFYNTEFYWGPRKNVTALYLSQIIKAEEVILYEHDDLFESYDILFTVFIDRWKEDDKHSDEIITKFRLDEIDVKYIGPSKIEAKQYFDKEIEEYKFQNDIKNFNL